MQQNFIDSNSVKSNQRFVIKFDVIKSLQKKFRLPLQSFKICHLSKYYLKYNIFRDNQCYAILTNDVTAI